MTTKKTNTNKPIETLRDAAVKVTIWRNQSEKGVFFTAKFSRTWQDADGKYHDSQNFSGTQLLQIQNLAEIAYNRMIELRQAEKVPANDDNKNAV